MILLSIFVILAQSFSAGVSVTGTTGAEIDDDFATDPFSSRFTRQPGGSEDFTFVTDHIDWTYVDDTFFPYAQSTTPLSSEDHWVCAKITWDSSANARRGVTLRGDDGTGSDIRYNFELKLNNLTAWNRTTGTTREQIYSDTTCGTLTYTTTAGPVLCVQVAGTGSGTQISAWIDPTIDATPDPSDWGAAECTVCASGCDVTADCTTGSLCADSGSYVGVGVSRGSGTAQVDFDDFLASATD